MRVRMNRRTALFCRVVMQLDRIPRYGRLYRMPRDPETGKLYRSTSLMIKEWRWQRRGRWGMNLLDKMGLFWPYLDHCNPGLKDWEGEHHRQIEETGTCECCSPETPTDTPPTSSI